MDPYADASLHDEMNSTAHARFWSRVDQDGPGAGYGEVPPMIRGTDDSVSVGQALKMPLFIGSLIG